MDLNPSEVIALSATVIALSATGATFWQAALTRRHNRLSVRPILQIGCEWAHDVPVSMKLQNTGIGPAILQGIEWSLPPHIRIVLDAGRQVPEFFRHLRLDSYRYRFYQPERGEALAVGQSISLFEFTTMECDERTVIRSRLEALTVTVTYDSIYGERFFCKIEPRWSLED